MYAEFIDDFRQRRQAQSRGIACQQPKAMPTRNGNVLLPLRQQHLIERTKSRRKKFLASLRKGAFGNGTDKAGMPGQAAKEIVEFALQASDKAPSQRTDNGSKGQSTAAGEIRRAGTMRSDEAFGLKRSSDLGKQAGMEVAKSFRIYPIEN